METDQSPYAEYTVSLLVSAGEPEEAALAVINMFREADRLPIVTVTDPRGHSIDIDTDDLLARLLGLEPEPADEDTPEDA